MGAYGRRFLARLIDTVVTMLIATVLWIPMFVVAAVYDPKGDGPWFPVAFGGFYLFCFACFFCYDWLLLAKWSRTLGKRWLRLDVVNVPSGARLTPKQAAKRAALYPLLFITVFNFLTCGVVLWLSYLWPLWDEPYRQALHDKMAKTTVTRR